MFSSIDSKVEAIMDYWQEPNVTRAPHNFTAGVWVRDLPGVEGGVTYSSNEVKQNSSCLKDIRFNIKTCSNLKKSC